MGGAGFVATCALVLCALLAHEAHVGGTTRAEVIAATFAFIGPLFLYVFTLAPTVTLEDSGEFIVAAHHLGVAHPSGYPLWCLVAHPFTWLPWGTIAERVHLSSAVFGAASVWMTYLVAMRLVRDWRAALVGALGLGASAVLWSQSVVAEVYSLNAFLSVLLLYLGMRWRDDRRARWLYGLAFTLGAGLTNHPLIALIGLPLFAWLLWVDARAVLRVRVLAVGALLFMLGLSIYAYLPLRASAVPPLNVGNPATLEATLAHIARDVYSGGNEAARTSGGPWDGALHCVDAWVGTGRALGWPLALLGLFGLGCFPRERCDALWLTVAIALAATFVLNGLMSAPHRPLWVYLHRVYYIPVHEMVALWIAVAAAHLFRVADRGGRGRAVATAGAFAVLVLATVWTSYPSAHRQDDRMGRQLALDLLDSAPRNGGFVPFTDDVLYPVMYARWVEGLRPDVELLSRQYGWDGGRYSVALIGDPVNDQLREDLPGLRNLVSIPRGIVYVLVSPEVASRESYASFVPLPNPPREIDFDRVEDDWFVDGVRARYAAYHARLGAKFVATGDRERGLVELDRAEALDPGDAHVEVLLAKIYRDLKIRSERQRPLLEAALENYDQRLDPHSRRYYAVQRDEISDLLSGLPAKDRDQGLESAGGA